MTTIRVSAATRRTLAEFKTDRAQSYDQVIAKLLALVPDGDEEGRYSGAFRAGLLQAMSDIREGRVVAHRDVKRRLGL